MKRILVAAVVLSLNFSGMVFAENNHNQSSQDISDRLDSITLRIDALEAQNKELKKENATLEAKSAAQQAKDEHALKFSGMAYIRSEWNNNPHGNGYYNYFTGYPSAKNDTRMLYYLFMDQKLDDKSYIHALIGGEGLSGYYGNHDNPSPAQFYEASYGSKFGNVDWEAGRMTAHVGTGIVYCGGWADGIRLGFGNQIKSRLYWVNQGGYSWLLGDATSNLNKNTKVTLSFAKTGIVGPLMPDDRYNTKAIGMEYTGITNVDLTGEYGANTASYAKFLNGGTTPTAYFVKVKYKGANPAVPGTSGAFIAYVNGQRGYDSQGYAGDHKSFDLEGPYNFTYPSGGFFIDNNQGVVVGVETTVARNAMFQVSYGTTKALSDDPGRAITKGETSKYVISRLAWFF